MIHYNTLGEVIAYRRYSNVMVMELLKSEFDNIVKTNDIVYDFIQESTLEGFWYLDLENRLNVYPNARFLKSIGYDSQEYDLVVAHWKDMLCVDELEAIVLLFKPGQTPFQLLANQPLHYRHRNGFSSLTNNDVLVFFNEEGDAVRLLVGVKAFADELIYTMDITARRRFEDELRISEESFRGTFEHAAIGMALVNPDGKWLKVNKSLSAMLGYSEQELLKLSFQDITHPEDLETDLNFLNELVAGKRISYEMEKRYINKQGVIVWTILSVSLVRDQEGNPLHFVSQITNNTERKIAEQRLEDSLVKLEGILEASTQVSIISTDNEGMITSFNKGAENLLGYKAEELIMKQSLSIFHVEQEVVQRGQELSEIFGKDIAGLNVILAYPKLGQSETREWTYLRKDGLSFPVQSVVTAITNGKGEIDGFLEISTDISKIKEVENEIKALLNVTKDQNHRLLNFAHIVSHNLRSHTSNIDKLLDFIEEDDELASGNELLGMLRRAANNLKETIDHLNEVVIMNNVTEENLVPCNLKHVIFRATENVQALLKSIGGKFECHADDDLTVAAVPAYLDSILINLLSNAIKYRSEKRALQIVIRAVPQGDFIKISIQDNGLGIDLATKGSRMFGMYETFHEGKDSRGIGLFITRNQVEAMAGSIEVVSRVEVGTTFEVYLKRCVE